MEESIDLILLRRRDDDPPQDNIIDSRDAVLGASYRLSKEGRNFQFRDDDRADFRSKVLGVFQQATSSEGTDISAMIIALQNGKIEDLVLVRHLLNYLLSQGNTEAIVKIFADDIHISGFVSRPSISTDWSRQAWFIECVSFVAEHLLQFINSDDVLTAIAVVDTNEANINMLISVLENSMDYRRIALIRTKNPCQKIRHIAAGALDKNVLSINDLPVLECIVRHGTDSRARLLAVGRIRSIHGGNNVFLQRLLTDEGPAQYISDVVKQAVRDAIANPEEKEPPLLV